MWRGGRIFLSFFLGLHVAQVAATRSFDPTLPVGEIPTHTPIRPSISMTPFTNITSPTLLPQDLVSDISSLAALLLATASQPTLILPTALPNTTIPSHFNHSTPSTNANTSTFSTHTPKSTPLTFPNATALLPSPTTTTTSITSQTQTSSATSTSTPIFSSKAAEKADLTNAQLAGAIFGSIIGASLAVIALLFLFLRRRRQRVLRQEREIEQASWFGHGTAESGSTGVLPPGAVVGGSNAGAGVGMGKGKGRARMEGTCLYDPPVSPVLADVLGVRLPRTNGARGPAMSNMSMSMNMNTPGAFAPPSPVSPSSVYAGPFAARAIGRRSGRARRGVIPLSRVYEEEGNPFEGSDSPVTVVGAQKDGDLLEVPEWVGELPRPRSGTFELE